MIKEIIQNIKITALTDKATAKLNQMKSTMNSIPKLLLLKTLNYDKAITSMKNSMLSLATIATAAVSVIRKGFLGLAELLQSIKRLNTAILITGTQATISASSLMNYFLTLLTGIGLAADELANVASKFVSAGISSLSMVRQYTNAAIGLALQTGKSVDEVSDILIRAMQGQTKGLKLFGIATNTGATAQLLLNEALRRGSIAFNNIDTNSATRSMMIFKLSFNAMLLGFAVKFLPTISSMINFIAKNLNVIGNILLGATIFATMKRLYNLGKAIYVLTVSQGAALIKLIKSKLSIVDLEIQRYQIMLLEGPLLASQQKALDQRLATQKFYNKKLNETNTLAGTLSGIFSKSNLILLASTVVLTLILTNWTKIKLKITGVTELTKKMQEASGNYMAELFQNIGNIVGQLKYYAKQQELTNAEIKNRNGLIKLYNTKYASQYNTALIKENSSIQDIDASVSGLVDNLRNLITMKIQSNIIDTMVENDAFKKLGLQIVKSQQYIALTNAQINNLKASMSTGEYAVSASEKSMWDAKINLLQSYVDRLTIILNNRKNEVARLIKLATDIASQFAPVIPLAEPEPRGAAVYTSKIANAKKYSNTIILLTQAWHEYYTVTKNILMQQSTLLSLINSYNRALVDLNLNTIERILLMKQLYQAREDYNALSLSTGLEDPMNGLSALQQILLSPILKANYTAATLQQTFLNIFQKIGEAYDVLILNIADGLNEVIWEGESFSKTMKAVFKDFTENVLKDLGKIITKMLLMFAIKSFLNVITGGAAEYLDAASLIPTGAGDLPSTGGFASIGKGGKNSSSNSIISISTSNLLYSGKNNMINKLDEVITAVSNIQPVQTQIIDLPTLATANKIGNAMILQGI